MSVLVKGMEMPKSCLDCPMLEGDRMDGLCHAASKWLDDVEYWTWYVYPEGDMDNSKPCNCPLIPIPPHGRLIDADKLRTDIKFGKNRFGSSTFLDYYDVSTIKNAPTIIEAEED